MAIRVGVCRVSMIFAWPSTKEISASGSVTTWIKFLTSLATSLSRRADGKIGGRATIPLRSPVSSITCGRTGVSTGGLPTLIGSTGMTRGTFSDGRGMGAGSGVRSIAAPLGRLPVAPATGGWLTGGIGTPGLPSAVRVAAVPEGIATPAPAAPGAGFGVCARQRCMSGDRQVRSRANAAAAAAAPSGASPSSEMR